MSSIVNGVTDIIESVLSLPFEIGSSIGNVFSDLFDWLNPLSEDFILAKIINWLNPFSDDFILKIFFEWITDLLKEIFVPDTVKLKEDFNVMIISIRNKLGLSFDGVEDFSKDWTERPPEDLHSYYTINGVGTFHLKFFDNNYLVKGVEYFRPLIRGFVVLLLILYNYYQILSFIGQDPRISANAVNDANEHLKGKEK